MATVVVIEDDAAIRSAIVRLLTASGHTVQAADRGLNGLSRVVEARPDAVVLDLGLPDIDGLELLKMIRAVSQVPIIIVTARDSDEEVVSGLDAGADDYLPKPFSGEQLDARVRAVLRRASTREQALESIVVGELRIDVAAHKVTLAGSDVELSRKEFELLRYLAEHRDRVVSKRELLAEVWEQPYGGGDRTIDVHLSWLRRKLGETAENPRFLHTTRGVGLRLVTPTPAGPEAVGE